MFDRPAGASAGFEGVQWIRGGGAAEPVARESRPWRKDVVQPACPVRGPNARRVFVEVVAGSLTESVVTTVHTRTACGTGALDVTEVVDPIGGC